MPDRVVVGVGLVTAVVVGVVGATMAFRVRRHRRGPARVARRHERTIDVDPSGAGVVVVVNPGGGSADPGMVEALEAGLPDATVEVLAEGDDLLEALEAAASRPGVLVLGVAGGDGSVNAAAPVAVAHDLPLLVVPGGTLNHLARDLGLDDVEASVAAARAGGAVAADLPTIGGRPFLNTASFGSYAELVDAREGLEDRIGKWPAVLVAGWRVLRRCAPVEVELDGERRSLWMVFIGNGRYEPQGFAPSRRVRLDDGVLDVRCIEADHPGARTRLVLGLLSGRLGRSAVYDEWTTDRLVIRSLEGPLRLACDGETFDGDEVVEVVKDGGRVVLLSADPT